MAAGSDRLFRPLLLSVLIFSLVAAAASARDEDPLPGGTLEITDSAADRIGFCPLERTDVDVTISGLFARVKVQQVFRNLVDRRVEAIYVFPLSRNAAVDDMVMTVGDRRIRSVIRSREEARKIYEKAKAAGRTAGLLDQERPNVFTQSVANIGPGEMVTISISYVETLKQEAGSYEFVFPMTVEPRYMPGGVTPGGITPGATRPGKRGTGFATDTCLVPDASRISPCVARPGTRAGHDIGLKVTLDTALPLFDLQSVLHDVTITHRGTGCAEIALRDKAEIPNRDFILRYRLAGEEIGDAFFVHEDERGKFFTLVLQPPRRYGPMEQVPRELIFVLDTSGSMKGLPIEKAKETMSRAIDAMRPQDTFNLIRFAGDTSVLWKEPRPNTPENRSEAQDFLGSQYGSGGTEMMNAIDAALRRRGTAGSRGEVTYIAGRDGDANSPEPIRIVCFMTDGCVGNDLAIIDAVKKNAGTTRVFSFGIGNSVNRFLLDGMAFAGRGEVEYVTLRTYAGGAVKRFSERIAAPLLTDIEIDWGGLPVRSVFPKNVPDLFGAKPVVIHGRLRDEGAGTVTLRGTTGSGPFARQVRIDSRTANRGNDALATLWAREKVRSLLNQDLAGLQQGKLSPKLKKKVTRTGLDYRLLTPFTSFVAVSERIAGGRGKGKTVPVSIELPEGVSSEGFGGSTVRKGRVPPNMGGPTSPSPSPGGFFYGPSGPSTPGPRGASTGGMGRKRYTGGMGYERWEFWWEHNKDCFLSGRRQSSPARAGRIAAEVLPSLAGALASNDRDILDSALLAAARVATPATVAELQVAIRDQLASRLGTVRQSAVLALGILDTPEARRICRELAADTEAGRKLTVEPEVPRLTRAFAALSLGRMGDRDAVPLLKELVLKEGRNERKDLTACAILALGLIGAGEVESGAAESTGIFSFLVDRLDDTRIEPFVHSYVPIALGKLGNCAALPRLLEILGRQGTNNWIRQSCTIAVGALATIEDREAVEFLETYAVKGKDQMTRHFSFIALARIGARDEDFGRHRDQHESLAAFFVRQIERPSKVQHLSWAAIAAAIHARGRTPLAIPLTTLLSRTFSRCKDPSEKGALAIGLGLLDACSTAEKLFSELRSTRNKALQGHLCVALGLMKWRKAVTVIREHAADEVVFRLRLQAAAALGIMGDGGAVDVLIRSLRTGQTLSVSSSAARALGLIGDARAIPGLLALLDDPRAVPLARAFAAVAIGKIGEGAAGTGRDTLWTGLNYRTRVDAISEVLDIL